jgi:hypothetical protein
MEYHPKKNEGEMASLCVAHDAKFTSFFLDDSYITKENKKIQSLSFNYSRVFSLIYGNWYRYTAPFPTPKNLVFFPNFEAKNSNFTCLNIDHHDDQHRNIFTVLNCCTS